MGTTSAATTWWACSRRCWPATSTASASPWAPSPCPPSRCPAAGASPSTSTRTAGGRSNQRIPQKRLVFQHANFTQTLLFYKINGSLVEKKKNTKKKKKKKKKK